MWDIKTILKDFIRTKNFQEFINNRFSAKYEIIVSYKYKRGIIDKIIPLRNYFCMGVNEAYQIFMAVEATKKIKGDIAEVGVYKGGSAMVICEAKKNKQLHLFDTFMGLPDVCDIDLNNPTGVPFHEGNYCMSLEDVKNNLKDYKNVYFYKGIFPKTAQPIKDKLFSFVNLDVDLYKSTIDCLQFFYPRISKGGIIISHDYNIQSEGVKKAFNEFFIDKPEPIIELSGSQCLIIKT